MVENEVFYIPLILLYWCFVYGFNNWAIKNYKALLWVAVFICLSGNIIGLICQLKYHQDNEYGAYAGPLLCICIYKPYFEWFKKKYNRTPNSIFRTLRPPYPEGTTDTEWGLNFLVFWVVIILTAATGWIYKLHF